MISMKVTGLDKLQRELEEAQRAFQFQALDGTIATLRFNPDEPASIQEAIRQMAVPLEFHTGAPVSDVDVAHGITATVVLCATTMHLNVGMVDLCKS